MIIRNLSLKNVRSYTELNLVFPEGSTLLSGDIGSGKTSILLALQFALFGLQPGQKGSSVLRSGEDTAEVNLVFQIDEKEVKICRTIKKSKSGAFSQDSNTISIDGITEDLSTLELKNRVMDLLGYPKEFAKKSDILYKFTVYTPQEGMKEIIQERPEVRLNILRHIFGIDRYKRIKENCTILTQEIKENIKLKEGLSEDINSLKERLVLDSERKTKKTKEHNDITIELSSLKNQKELIEKEIENLKEKIEERKKIEVDISKKEIEIRGKEALKSKVEREINLLKGQISNEVEFSQDRLNSIITLLEKHKSLLEDLRSRFLAISSSISVLSLQKEKAFEMKEKIKSIEFCPTCFQNVSQEHKEKINKKAGYEMEEAMRDLDQKIFDKEQLMKDIEKEKEIIRGYEQDKLSLERDKINFEHKRVLETKLKSELFVLERILSEIQENRNETEELKKKFSLFSEIGSTYEDQDMKLLAITSKFREAEINFAETKKEIELLKEKLDEEEKELSKREKIKLEANYLRELLDWLETTFLSLISSTETNVLSKIRSDLSKLFSDWFSMLVSDSLTTKLDEDFTPIIFNQDYELDYEFLSGGERTAVALAYRLALNQMINSLMSEIKTKDILILDEPTDGFSERQLDKVRDIFDQLNSKQVILVSHEQKIEGFVDNVLRVSKDGTSKVEKGY